MKANRFNINEPNYEPGDARDDYVWDPRRKKNEDLSPFNEGDNRENKRDDIPSLIPGNDYGFVDELEMYQNFKVVKSERKKGGQTSNTNITVSTNGPLFTIGSSINIASYLESIMAGGGSIITSSALSAGLLIFSFIGLTGDTNENYDSFSKGSTKNERKINPKSKQSAESKVEDLEQQLSNAKTKNEKGERRH